MAGNCFWLLLHRASTLKGIDKFRLKHYRIPSAIYMFKVSKKQTRAMCQIYSKFFFFTIRVFFHRHWRFTGQQDNGGDHCLFRSTTSTCSQTFRHLFATLDARWLHVFLEYVLTWEAKWTHTGLEISNQRENKFCSHEVSFRLHFKTTQYFDGHV